MSGFPRPGIRAPMAVVPGITALTASYGRIFAVVGVFDGIHRGHAYLLRELRRAAVRHRARPTVITFDHHPDEILTGSAPPLLCDPQSRLDLLARAGVEITVVQAFDQALRQTPFDTFVRTIADRVDLAGLLMTPDAAFGHNRGGTPAAVAALGRELGYEVVVIPPIELDGQPLRSSEIRSAIAAGDLARAARLLGRPVTVRGVAVPGEAATGVVFALPVALPPDGRYAASVTPGDGARPLRRSLVVADGRVEIQPPLRVAAGTRLRVRLPVPGDPATIRRS